MRVKKEIICILLMATAMLLSACSSDNTEVQVVTTGEEPPVSRQVQVIAYAPLYIEKVSSSRTAPDGFSAYTPDKTTAMGIYMLQDGWTNPEEAKIIYNYNKWHAYFDVEANKSYTVYGYMPKADGMSSSVMNVTANSDILTISGIKPVTTDDICIITGVNETDDGLKEGKFSWFIANANDNFFMYLLLDHLYASVNFSLKIDGEYAQLRTIKLKTMTLSANKASVNAAVTLTHNTKGTSPIADEDDITYTPTDGSCEAKIFNTPEGLPLSSTTPIDVSACFAPILFNNLTLVSTYDVYDSKGNLIRQNCTATNKMPDLEVEVSRGERIQLNLTVNPTYLYVLSDPDLDNPTVVIKNN